MVVVVGKEEERLGLPEGEIEGAELKNWMELKEEEDRLFD